MVAAAGPRRLRLRRASEPGTVASWLLGALALMLILEGLLPFLRPGLWRRLFESALQMNDGQIRFLGLASVLGGLLLLAAVAP